tara:strand:- start:1890 stop:2435 length:546 start_codon:yes stop_codon:yes gene_type:complete
MNCSHIFHIGLNKAGTTSLSAAVERLGIKSVHNWHAQASFDKYLEKCQSPIAELPYHAWFDVRAFERSYPVLDWLYPYAKFIFTTRNKSAWLQSRERHVLRNIELKAAGTPRSNWLTIDYDAWSREYDFKHNFATKYFAGRMNKLLIINITAGDGYDVLCPFLGLPTLAEEFPRLNVSCHS